MAQSPDGRWLYVTGESQNGRLYVVDMSKAENGSAARRACHRPRRAALPPA